ncbi:50S ribosomal protein L10, chloroplastic-like [Mercurialis annua]|uniref:50S ribosomal protein L10, chloroplastic-like n=1 Tax=Mercurialis annua TaxID=3986 RepID=UPI002161098E|nr:50S ribosomal protein L10, chloroplastic-like [Mercurialis annua]
MNGMNAWLFVHTEEISEALELNVEENDFTCAVFEGGLYGPGGFRRLMSMPTRDEFYGGLLGGLQSPLIGLVCCLEAPVRDLIAEVED